MRDRFGRTIDYMRVSVTDKCSLRCLYCMPPEGVDWVPHGEVLSFEETLRICEASAALGISKIKVTGGEPLVRRGITSFIRALKRAAGVETVTLTTNGLALGDFLGELTEAGLDAVNISLDTLDRDVFRRITRSDEFERVIRSIDAACKTRIAVKLNCVPVRGVNEDDIIPLANFARRREIPIRYIELMPLGLGAAFSPVSQTEVIERLQGAFGALEPSGGRLGNGPAVYYTAAGFAGKIGFISALSHKFCRVCNRLRLTGTGFLRSCLSADTGVDMKAVVRAGGDDASIARAVREAVMLKPAGHNFYESGVGSQAKNTAENMFRIGG